LLQAGLKSGGCPETWNLERPDQIEAILCAYREAGAELLETNTFGGSPAKLEVYGLAGKCSEINRIGAEIGRRAADDDALVLGSVGPTGQLLQPLGPLSRKAALDGFRRQTAALAEGGADALCVETMTDLAEALLAVEAGVETGLPVMVTLTYDPTPRGFFTIMGNDIATAAAELEAAGAFAIGTNCGTGPETMVDMVRELRAATPLDILVQPNAGLPELSEGKLFYGQTPEIMASYVPTLVEAGATIVGGCCGTTPDHIRAMGAEIRRLRVLSVDVV
jgi:5-methyltetrahydrofolate--homocysteine methyltransferase